MFFHFFLLAESRVAGGEEKILFHNRLKIDKYDHQDEQHGRDREHFPMRAGQSLPNSERSFHRFIPQLYRRSMPRFVHSHRVGSKRFPPGTSVTPA